MKNPRMTARQLAHLGGLLWMKYKPSELADEIGCITDTIYKSYIPAGCPHERDATGQIWIVGIEFSTWARKTFGGRSKSVRTTNMGRYQAWCMKCRKPVDVVEMEIGDRDRVEMINGRCAVCGSKVYRLRTK